MNKVLMSLLFSAFVLTGASFAQNPPPAASTPVAPAAAPADVAVEKPKHEHHAASGHHSEIRKAMRKLRAAKEDLEKASRDFAGHRAAAIGYIEQALAELKTAVDSDKK